MSARAIAIVTVIVIVDPELSTVPSWLLDNGYTKQVLVSDLSEKNGGRWRTTAHELT